MNNHSDQVSDAAFREILSREYRIVEMPMDGNCLFSAFAEKFHESFVNQQECRQVLWDYIDQNFEDMAEFLDLDDDDTRNELAAIGVNGEWGGNFAIYAACNVYICNIHILEANNPEKIFEPVQPPEAPTHVFLSYHNGVHYNLLHPLVDDDDADSSSSDKDEDCEDDPLFNESDAEYDDSSSEMDVDANSSLERKHKKVPKLSAPSFPFTAHGFYKRSRATLTFAVLVPVANLKYPNLLTAIQKVNPKKVYFVTLYNPTNIKQLYSDCDIGSAFTVYTQKYLVPINIKMHDRGMWLSHAMIIPVLLSVIGFSWKNITIAVMCKKTNCSKPVEILNNVWSKVRSFVIEEVEYILANSETFFCLNCSKTCPHIYKPWHTDISKYLLQQVTADSEEFGKIFNTFDHPNYFGMAPIMARLVDVYDSDDLILDKWINLKNELNENSERRKDYTYTTYLVLHLDGTGISKYSSKEVTKMLNDENIKKSVYAGRASNKPFRETHFSNPSSSIYKALTRTSKLYFIRKKEFQNLPEAQLDEAIVIEILKVYLNWMQQNEGYHPFLLMNIRSENCCILPTEDKEKDQINSFCKSGIPIFRIDPTDLRQFDYARFHGNYDITEPITMLPGGYEVRRFSDQVIQEYYAELEGRRPK